MARSKSLGTSQFSVYDVNKHDLQNISNEENARLYLKNAQKYTDALRDNLAIHFDPQEMFDALRNNAYFEIDSLLEHQDFVSAAQKFEDFLTLPTDIKKLFVAKMPREKGADVGYVRKNREQGDTDNKEFFHYNLYADKALTPHINAIPQAREFIYAARKVYLGAVTQIMMMLKAMESKYPGISAEFFADKKWPHFFIRFLSYDINTEETKDKEFAAKGHYDRGSMTIAWAESHPGLRIGAYESKLSPVVHKSGKAKFFLSRYFPELILNKYPESVAHYRNQISKEMIDNLLLDDIGQLTNSKHPINSENFRQRMLDKLTDDMPLGFHDVVQNNEGKKKAKRRWAIVSFFDALNEEELAYEQTHTALKK